MVVFHLPFQSSGSGADVTTSRDIKAIKDVWGDRAPLGDGGHFHVVASLPAGVEESDETVLLIQRRINSAVFHAGVSDKAPSSISVSFESGGDLGLEITPGIFMDPDGNPLVARRQ